MKGLLGPFLLLSSLAFSLISPAIKRHAAFPLLASVLRFGYHWMVLAFYQPVLGIHNSASCILGQRFSA
jgi:hypothetical protein